MYGPPVSNPKPTRGMGARALLVSAATMLSRVLGLAREQLFALLLGATAYSDAFVVAFRIPNLLRDLFAEGALSAAFVPTYAAALKESRARAIRLGNLVMATLGLVAGLVTLVGIGLSPELVAWMAPGFAATPGKSELAVLCTRIMFPFLPTVALAAVVMGQLNAEERFTAPSLASAMFNVVAILAGLGLWAGGVSPETAVIGWSIGTLGGGVAQLCVQLPSLFATGFRLRPALDLADPGVRRILRLMAPATLGLAATQTNLFVNTMFASQVEGAASWLNYAFRLIQLPIGVFGVAVATVATTGLAKRAAEHDLPGMREVLGQGLRLVAFLTVPSTIGLIVLREPITRLLFERGRFGPGDTAATADAILLYAIGLYAYAAVKVIAPAFYALDRPRWPLVASVASVVANVALNVTLFPVLGFRGVALGTSVSALLNFTILLAAFGAIAGGVGLAKLLWHLLRVALAAAACGAAAFTVFGPLDASLGRSLPAQMLTVGAACAAGALAYALAAKGVRLPELQAVTDRLGRRLRR